MGEKPLGSDEATPQVGTLVDTAGQDETMDPMAGAAGIITTRSNIKHTASGKPKAPATTSTGPVAHGVETGSGPGAEAP